MTHVLSEQAIAQALASLWQETEQAHFLRSVSAYEWHKTLEARRSFTGHLLSLLESERERAQCNAKAPFLMLDYYYTLLTAELNWLDRAIAMLDDDPEKGSV
ncbi:hypothetical protein EPA93_07620 [Ktedonosporobacter rubrisoli]|uniref:Uncharacterized protein n=1 Tax=Ktedonosporobacter rubrisoli TaxID=2509675 RepID=A0A4P6JLC9_KTERU|nr:hypothetical protein [Ktedonosporobacter rubrisoli]QBD75883.1 hypothetical protein EPA93_07620 [Ktedonosporobacter rubrisoli]